MDASSLIDRYCEVWSEPQESRRTELLSSLWGSHATYTDPSVHAANAEELLSHIANVQARRPGASVLRTAKSISMTALRGSRGMSFKPTALLCRRA